MIIDTHCHFDMMPNPEAYIFQKDMDGDGGIGMTNLPSHFNLGISHVLKYKHIRLSLGLHPLLAADHFDEVGMFKKYLHKTSYVGEIGLDYSKEGYSTKDIQVSVLRDILMELKGKKKIISIHSRRAEKTVLNLLNEFNIENVIFHWYSGPIGLIPSIVSCGYYFSVNEAMIVSKTGKSIVENIPRDRILTETDAPFNSKNDIRNVLEYLQLTEIEAKNNFMNLIARIR